MDQNPDSSAPEPKKDEAKAPDVSMSMSDPAPTASAAPMAAGAVNPGHTFGIVSLILSILGVSVPGIIVGAIGLSKSKKAGQTNGLALAGIIVGAVGFVIALIATVLIVGAGVQLASKCAELGNGTHVVGGVEYTCNL